jgi:hypothetical protein
MKTSELRKAIKDLNLSGIVSCDFTRKDSVDGKYHHVVIGNSRLSFSTQKEQEKVFDLLVYKFGFEKEQSTQSTLSEEDRGYFEGWAADMADPEQHGRTVAVGITSEHRGTHLVWDYNLQKVVDIENLTPSPR